MPATGSFKQRLLLSVLELQTFVLHELKNPQEKKIPKHFSEAKNVLCTTGIDPAERKPHKSVITDHEKVKEALFRTSVF